MNARQQFHVTELQVILRSGSLDAPALVYAASWWRAETIDTYLRDKSMPIWVSLSQGKVQVFRDLRRVYKGHSQELEAVFQEAGPFWGRHYIFWHDGQPLTVIYEVFSPRLGDLLQ